MLDPTTSGCDDDRARRQRPAAGRKRAPGESYEAARRRKESALADLRQLEARKRKGEVLDAETVAREWERLAGDVRSGLLAIPSRLRSRLPHMTAEDLAVLDEEVRAALTSLADGSSTG